MMEKLGYLIETWGPKTLVVGVIANTAFSWESVTSIAIVLVALIILIERIVAIKNGISISPYQIRELERNIQSIQNAVADLNHERADRDREFSDRLSAVREDVTFIRGRLGHAQD